MKLKQIYEAEDNLQISQAQSKAYKWFETYLKKSDNFNPLIPNIIVDKNTYEVTWSVHDDCSIAGAPDIPYECTKAGGGMLITSETITSLKNVPREVDGNFMISTLCKSLKSLEHIPSVIKGHLNISSPSITSLKNIHNLVSEVHGNIILTHVIKSNILGLILIKGVKNIKCYSHETEKPYMRAFAIVNKYLGQGQQGVIKAQREMIDDDLEDFAEL